MTDQEAVAVFFGRVHPERAVVNIDGLSPLRIGLSPDALVEASVRVNVSQVTARVSGTLHPDLATERNAIGSVAQLLVDVLGFTNGCGYTVEIIGSNKNDGTAIFGCDIPALAAEPLEAPVSFGVIANLVLNDTGRKLLPLRRALGDFRRAILDPDDTPFHCYRAVEALTFYFDAERSRGWSALRHALNLDETWIKTELKEPADRIRHGQAVAVTGDDRLRAFRASRTIIARFVTLLHLELPRLPEQDYPIVSSA